MESSRAKSEKREMVNNVVSAELQRCVDIYDKTGKFESTGNETPGTAAELAVFVNRTKNNKTIKKYAVLVLGETCGAKSVDDFYRLGEPSGKKMKLGSFIACKAIGVLRDQIERQYDQSSN